MEKVKSILKIWLLKYWYLLALCVTMAYGLFFIFKNEKKEDFFICRMQGSTFMISRMSINEYMAPLNMSLSEKEYSAGERVLGVKSDLLKKIKTIVYDAQAVIEEQNIRYEYLITITAYDTVGFYILEDALIKHISNHPLVQENYNNKVKKFITDTSLIQADLHRIDSTVATLKNTQTEFYETLMQKKVDLKLQLSKLEGKFNENYIHKRIYGFEDSYTKIDTTSEKNKVSLLQWLLIFVVFDFILVFIINKQFRQLFLS